MRNKNALAIVISALMVGVGIILIGQFGGSKTINTELANNVEIKDGIQYITIKAKGGYYPKVSKAQANTPTKLIVETNGTYDCSAALVIRAINYQKVLSQSGGEVIDLGSPKPGTIQGVCGMGMYNFSINFE